MKLTGVLRVHMGRVEAEVDEEGDGHSELEPLHHVGLPVERVGHVTSQNHGVPSTGRHKLGLLPDSVGTCSTKCECVLCTTHNTQHVFTKRMHCVLFSKQKRKVTRWGPAHVRHNGSTFPLTISQAKVLQHNFIK